jgi:sugar lactone lactonase YvrE
MISLPLSVRFLAGIVLLSGSLLAGPTTNPVTNPPGYTFTTIAGNPGLAGSSDGVGTNATFNSPQALAVDTNGNLFIADTGNNMIRKIDTNGNVITLAGGIVGYQDGQGGSAKFNSPEGIAVDTNGLIYVSDTSNNVLRLIDTNGVVSTFAGIYINNFPFYYTNPSVSSTTPIKGGSYVGNFALPTGLSFDTNGQLLVAQKVPTSFGAPGVLSWVTTNGIITNTVGLYSGSLDTAVVAGPNNRYFYVSNGGPDATKYSLIGEYDIYDSPKVVAGSGGWVQLLQGMVGNADGVGTNSRLNHPSGLALDQKGDLFITDSGNNSIRLIDLNNSNAVTTLSLNDGLSNNVPNTPGSTDGFGTNARFSNPTGIAVDAKGVIYIADSGNHTIRKGVPPASQLTQTLSWTNFPATVKLSVNSVSSALSASSGLTPELSSSNPNVATVSGTTVFLSGTGTVTLTASQPGNVFYKAATPITKKLVVTKGIQTIQNFPPFAAHTYMDAPIYIMPIPTGMGNLPVSITSSKKNVAIYTNNAIQIVGAGLTTITATAPGNSNYLPPPPVHQVLVVNKAPQTISFATASTYSVGMNPSLSGTSTSGLPLKYTSSNPKVISISKNMAKALSVGPVNIIATQDGNANYLKATPVTSSISVLLPNSGE